MSEALLRVKLLTSISSRLWTILEGSGGSVSGIINPLSGVSLLITKFITYLLSPLNLQVLLIRNQKAKVLKGKEPGTRWELCSAC